MVYSVAFAHNFLQVEDFMWDKVSVLWSELELLGVPTVRSPLGTDSKNVYVENLEESISGGDRIHPER